MWASVKENSFMRPDPNHRLNSQHQGKMPFPVGLKSIPLGFQICQTDSNPEIISPASTSIQTSVPTHQGEEDSPTSTSFIHSFIQ